MSSIISTHAGSLAAPLASSDDALIEMWLGKGKRKRTQKSYAQAIERLRDWLTAQGITELRAVTAAHLWAYEQSLPAHWSPNMRNTALAPVKSLWTFGCKLNSYFVFNVPAAIWTLEKPRLVTTERILTTAQVKAAIAAEPEPAAKLFLRFLFGTACRAAEALAVTWGDFHLRGQRYTIILQDPKGGEPREIGCVASVWKDVVSLPHTEPSKRVFDISYPTCHRWIRLSFARVDLPEVSPHWVRHAAVVALREAGADWPAIARQLGHKQVSTTLNNYAHLTEGFATDLIDC